MRQAEIYQEDRAKKMRLPEGTGKRYSREDIEAFCDEVDREGYAYVGEDGHGGWVPRLLRDEEKTQLRDFRDKHVQGNAPMIELNARNFKDVVEGNDGAKRAKSVTIAFETPRDLDEFTKYVADIGRKEETHYSHLLPLRGLRLKPLLLRDFIAEGMKLRPVTIADIQKDIGRVVSPRPFDIANLKNNPMFEEPRK